MIEEKILKSGGSSTHNFEKHGYWSIQWTHTNCTSDFSFAYLALAYLALTGNWKFSWGSHFAEGIDGCLAVTGLKEIEIVCHKTEWC